MANSGFFDGGAEYGQEDFNRYFDNLFYSGVSIDDSGNMTMGVKAGSGQVTVASGYAILRGFYCSVPDARAFTVTPDSNYDRIDRVVIHVNMLTGPAELMVIKGTPGSTPNAPAITRDDSTYEISLAQIRITPAGGITVTDERADQSVCGAIRPKNMTEYKGMVAEYQRQWDAWFARQQGTGWRNIYIQQAEPGEAVAGSIWIRTQ